jgi:hypothetical protein
VKKKYGAPQRRIFCMPNTLEVAIHANGDGVSGSELLTRDCLCNRDLQ